MGYCLLWKKTEKLLKSIKSMNCIQVYGVLCWKFLNYTMLKDVLGYYGKHLKSLTPLKISHNGAISRYLAIWWNFTLDCLGISNPIVPLNNYWKLMIATQKLICKTGKYLHNLKKQHVLLDNNLSPNTVFSFLAI